ncbi:hypothetical protein [Acinetobacter junii]|uniref:hypothetical protein n=1 Tax=Acinetobacter junii TaxID=40215 RepID=UPI0024AE1026|nr:hypothetical protein [Acinetobacter junii]MDI6619899.1 hypothetical protein [Acinetobacter junii]
MSVTSKVAPDGIMGAAITTVIDQMDKLDEISSRYRRELSDSLSSIKQVAVTQIDAPIRMEVPETPVPNIDLSDAPKFSRIQMSKPELPVFESIDSLLSELNLDDLNMPDPPVMPTIELPSTPGIINIPVPERPMVNTDIEIPEAPVLDMPEMDTLKQIEIPEFNFPELLDFDGVPPSIEGISVPNVFINWKEPEYKSEILDELSLYISEGMKGGTGLPIPIEEALFNRARARESREVSRAVNEAIGDWSSRNFTMPPGMLVKQIAAIREDGQLKAAELNRDILIEASKMEIEQLRFLVQQGMSLEQLTSNIFNNTATRLFEVARFNAESQISVFNAQVAFFNAQNEAFKTLSDVYRTKLDGALAKLSAYKTAVDAQVAVGQINEQYVQVYRAKMDAVQSNVEVYKALIQGASLRAEVMKNQFDSYRADVQAYSEQIGAEKVKVEAYEAQIRGETSKASLFDAQARAYASTIQGIQAKANIKGQQIQLKMEAARVWISKYQADLESYKAELQANLSEVQQNTAAFSAEVDAWRASAGMEVSQAEMQSRYADMNTRTNIAYAEMQLKEYEAKMQKAVQEANIALESAKAMGQYSAQLAAGAMSAAHVSASISGNGSTSSSYSNSDSKSESYNYER